MTHAMPMCDQPVRQNKLFQLERWWTVFHLIGSQVWPPRSAVQLATPNTTLAEPANASRIAPLLNSALAELHARRQTFQR